MRLQWLFPGFVVLGLSACATMPHLPDAPTMTAVETLETKQSFAGAIGVFPDGQWWQDYGDDVLDGLIAEGLADSPDIAAASARTRAAEAMARQAQASLFPTLSIEGRATGQKMSQNQVFPAEFIPGDLLSEGQLAGQFNFDLDLWGRNRSALSAARSEALAAQVDSAQVRNMIAAGIATRYFELQGLMQRLDIATQRQSLARQAEQLVDQRMRDGLDNAVALHDATALAEQLRAEVAVLQEAVALGRHALAILLGKGPDRGLSITPAPLPAGRAIAVPANLPMELLGRRPDIESARLRAQAAAQRVRQAKAAFYPSINLSAIAGWQAIQIGSLFETASHFTTFGPAISLPLFDGGARAANYRQKRSGYDEAVADYNATLLLALQQVADAIARKQQLAERLDAISQENQARVEAARLMQLRQKAGIANRLEWMDAQQSALKTDDRVNQVKVADLLGSVSLVVALGGGFDNANRARTGPINDPE